ncbi:hypothetical protein FRB94_009776 [Tulasnella sp. JGI-2019a]|nr:hypothetical protein FRB94_009776 [Tulasnella sp. JGI-2019a]
MHQALTYTSPLTTRTRKSSFSLPCDLTAPSRANTTHTPLSSANQSCPPMDLELDRKIVDETLEELDFLFIENTTARLKVDLSSKLGVGGYGEVYQADLFVALARQTIRVAVKTLRSDPSMDLRIAHRLLREISTWSSLRHPNVLSLIGFHLSPDLNTALLVCPLEPFGSVDHYLQKHSIDIPGRMELVAQATRGVAYLHSLKPPVTHGDIKAANTLINRQREAMLCDFGLAQSEFRSGLETSGDSIGTIPFCSPELLLRGERSPSSDMWALGCLVIEIVLGIKPFTGVKPSAQTITIILGGGLPASEEALRRPVNMWDGLIHCWHFDPKDRVQVSEFAKYWDLKMRSAGDPTATEGPICPKPTCRYRRQWLDVNNILDSIDRIFAAIGLLAVLARTLVVFYTILDRIRYNDENLGRALRALEALPRAKLAPWSAVDARSSCLEGTRVAVLKEIRKWYSNTAPNAPLFFDLDGVAGVGKTTIAHTIAEEAARDGYLAGSFFFTRGGEAELSNPTLAFPTLAYQIASFSPAFTHHFGRAAEAAPGAAYEDLRGQLQKLIISPLQCVPPPPKPLLVVLDALDECQKEGAKEILRLLLSEASKIPFPLKIFVTSRPEPHLRSICNHAINLHKVVLHDIEASIVKGDIRLYLQTSFAEISRKLDLQMGKAWARHDEIEVLVERAETLFIVAATFTRFAGDDLVRNPRQQLDLLLQRSESSFTGPNTTIDQLYLQILRKIRSTTGSPYIIERLRSMVGAIVTLRNPLPIPVIERLLGLPAGDGGRALHHLHSIISLPRSPVECPRIHHASFPDFITDPLRCIEPDLCIPQGTFEGRLAERCLQLTVFSAETGQSGKELDYACRWWPDHLEKAGYELDHALDRVEGVISRCLVWWFEAIDPSAKFKAADACPTEANTQMALHRFQSLASRVAAIALDAGHTRRAIEILQHTHDNSLVRLGQYRVALDALLAESPEIASEFSDLSLQLAHSVTINCMSTTGSHQVVLGVDSVERHLDLSKLWNDALKRIRELVGFSTFLKPISFEEPSNATRGHITIVNVTALRSVVITVQAGAEPVVIELQVDALRGAGPKLWTLHPASPPYFHQSITLSEHCRELLKYNSVGHNHDAKRIPTLAIEHVMNSSQSALNKAGILTSHGGKVDANPELDRLFSEAREAVRSGYKAVEPTGETTHTFINDMDNARMRDDLEVLARMLHKSPLPDRTRSAAAVIPEIAVQINLVSQSTRANKQAYGALALSVGELTNATLQPLQSFRSHSVTEPIEIALEKLHKEFIDLLECFNGLGKTVPSQDLSSESHNLTIDQLMTTMRSTMVTIQALLAGQAVPKATKPLSEDIDIARMCDKSEALAKALRSSRIPDRIRSVAAVIPEIALQINLVSQNIRANKRASKALALSIGELTNATLQPLQNLRPNSATEPIEVALGQLHKDLTELLDCFKGLAEATPSHGLSHGFYNLTIDRVMKRMRSTTATIQALLAG